MIQLAPFERADFAQLIAWSGDASFLMQWAGPTFQYPLTEQQLETYLQETNEREQTDKYSYKAVDTATGQVVGHLSLGRIDPHNRSARIGKVLVDPAQRGNGVGLAMIRAVLAIGFDEMKLHRISLGVFDFNEAARRCYLKAGFRQEGVLRDVRRMDDTYWSLIEMSVLDEEWRQATDR